MDQLAKETSEERELYFREAAARLALPPHIVEKDFWVCWTLRRLFSLPRLDGILLFKGGTSLSKAYGLIRRFSEDIDLSLKRESLGFAGKTDPAFPKLSNRERKQQLDALLKSVQNEIHEEVAPELKKEIRSELGEAGWELHPDDSDPDGQSLSFEYPRTGMTPGIADYLKPAVKIEFGARSDHWPTENRIVTPYLHDVLPEAMEKEGTEVTVLSATRTFWEKATILHQMAHLPAEKLFPMRYSRHYSDLASMISADIGDEAAAAEDVREAVVSHKMTFYRAAWARYEDAVPGSLRLLPADSRISDLAKDLISMKEMFFDSPPELDSILSTLEAWQTEFNQSA